MAPILTTGVGAYAAAAGASYNSNSTAFFTRVAAATSALSSTNKTNYDNLITSLVNNSIWSKLDALYIFAAQDSITALLNLVSSSYNATATNSPTFTAYTGFTGIPASSTYIDTGMDPTSGTPNYSRNSASLGVVNLSNRTTPGTYASMGRATAPNGEVDYLLPNYTGGVTYYGANDSGFINAASTTSKGFYVATRTASNATAGYRNGGAASATGSSASGVVSSGNFIILAEGQSTTRYTPDQLGAAFIGGGMSQTDVGNFYTALQTYFTANSITI